MRTKRTTGWLALVTGLLIAGSAFADNETSGPPGPTKDLSVIPGSIPQVEPTPTWSVPAEMPNVPAQATVFEIIPTDPQEPSEMVQALMQRFEFTPAETGFDEDENGIAAVMHTDANNRTVEIFRSGASFYMEESLFPEQGEDLLEVLQLDPASASEFFELEARNLFSEIGFDREGLRFGEVSFANLKTVQDGGNQESTKIVGAAAHFGYDLDGIPAWGPGAKTSVYFGENGPAGVYDAMPAFQPMTTVELFDPAQVVADYIAADEPQSLLRLYTGVVDETVIEEIKVTYYVGPGNGDQAYIEPHYLISGMMYGWNPGPDPQNPREGATQMDPAPFMWMEPASDPVPEPGLAAGLAFGAFALAGTTRRRDRRTVRNVA